MLILQYPIVMSIFASEYDAVYMVSLKTLLNLKY